MERTWRQPQALPGGEGCRSQRSLVGIWLQGQLHHIVFLQLIEWKNLGTETKVCGKPRWKVGLQPGSGSREHLDPQLSRLRCKQLARDRMSLQVGDCVDWPWSDYDYIVKEGAGWMLPKVLCYSSSLRICSGFPLVLVFFFPSHFHSCFFISFCFVFKSEFLFLAGYKT